MMTHDLKTWPQFFAAVAFGNRAIHRTQRHGRGDIRPDWRHGRRVRVAGRDAWCNWVEREGKTWLHTLVRPVDEYRAQVRSQDMGRPAEVVDVDANYFDDGDRRLALLWPSGTLLWLPVDDVERVTDERWGDR